MKSLSYIVLFVLLYQGSLFSQTFLRVTKTGPLSTKTYEIFNNEYLEYKLKGEFKFRKDKIIAMRDSTLLFEVYEEVKLNQIKALRIKTHNPLVGVFKNLFLMGGIGFIGLNTINNLITDTSPVFSEKAAYISAGLLATGLVIRELGIRRIRMTKNKDLKILTLDFQHMNTDSTATK